MNLKQLHRQLDQIAARLSRIRTLQLTASAFVLAALLGFVLWAVWTGTQTVWLSQNSVTVTLSLVLLALVTGLMLRRHRPDRHSAARAVEQHFPELNHRLLAALEQQPSLTTGRLTFLQNQVVSEALEHSRQNNWMNAVPTSRLASSALLQFTGVGLFAAAVSVLWLHPPVVAGIDRTGGSPEHQAVGGSSPFHVAVEPGDVEIERGTDLLVLARFNRQLPAEVSLVATDAQGEPLSIPLSKSLDDPVFGGRLTAVDRNTTYHVVFDGRRTPDFRITVFDFPALEQLDAVIHFPEYTGLPETTLRDARRVSVVEGSQLRLVGRANKPIVSARLIDDHDAAIDFEFASIPSTEFELTFTPSETQRFELILVDEAGRQNKFPEEIVIEITPNLPPDIKLTFPAKDLRVSPLEEVTLEATAWDDFGLQQHGLIYGLAGQEPTTLVLGESFTGREQCEMSSLLSMETLRAQPDQLLSYYFFADDFGPDGKLRRTYSDMYFAEVRHFEEIFRQGQQPPGGASKQQGGGSPQSKKLEELAKLQKQIVNATWKLIRRESSGPRTSDSFGDDVKLIADSQQAALDQLRKLEEKLQNPKSKGLVTNVAEQMTTALDKLTQAATENDDSPLVIAMSAEQSAYQGLLKLRAREHKVSKSQGGGGGGGGSSSRSQQQMNQLELSNKKNRYQTERTAAGKKSSPANREQLQVLNRLRDLARRQQGVNDKLKELENALREAQTEQEKEELRRRLKRLRDEQQEMLRDVDELRNRMDRPENQRKMAEDRRQLDQTREKIRQTSEALKEGQVSKALNSGTRTERELKNLKEDFRKRTANQFADEMKDLRNDSRALSEQQRELSEQLQTLDKGRRTLRDSGKRHEIARGMEEQKRNLDRILNRAKEVVRKAEQTEPLLSRKLYDTVRKARDDRAGEHLKTAAELADKGLTKEAAEAQQRAETGIDRVQQGIEQAAESVLGSETESLRTAKKDLDDVAKALKNELAQASPRKGAAAGSKPKQTVSSKAGNPKSETRKPKAQAQQSPSSSQSKGKSPGQSPDGKSSSGQSSQGTSSGQSSSAGKSSSGESSSGQSSSGQSSGGESSSGKSSGKSPGGRRPGLRGGDQQQGNQSKSRPGQPGQSSSSQGGLSGGPGSHGGEMKPLTGDDFRKWSDKLRDVEEMVEDPKLRDDVARVRDRARSMRVEFKRHSKEPNWDLVRETILQPLVELQQQLAEEIARRESPDSLVPIDREPVPERFSELVEEYYKRLGQGGKINHGDTETRR